MTIIHKDFKTMWYSIWVVDLWKNYSSTDRIASQLGNLELSGNLAALEKSQGNHFGEFHKNSKNQGKASEFLLCETNIVGTSFNTVPMLFSQNSFYHILCLIYIIARHQHILDCIWQWKSFIYKSIAKLILISALANCAWNQKSGEKK